MRKRNGVLMRQLAAAIFLSALAIAAMMGAIGAAGAADLPQAAAGRMIIHACDGPKEDVDIVRLVRYSDASGADALFHLPHRHSAAPTPIPPPPEYCCS